MTPPGPGTARVLLLSGLQIHPALSGGNLRSLALTNAMSRHGLEVFVHSLVGRKRDYLARRPSAIQAWPGGVEEYVDRGVLGFVAQFGSYALSLPPVWLTAWLHAAAASPREALLPAPLRERLAWCDAVVADFPFVHPVFAAPSARGRLRVLSTHNVEHRLYDGARRPWPRLLRETVRRIELRAAHGCDLLVACSAEDRAFFDAQPGAARSVLVPNGIDVRRFQGIEAHRERTRRELGVADDTLLVLFTGSKWGPNREAFERLLGFARSGDPLLAQRRVHILVVGGVAAQPVALPGFTATGKVDLVEPYFAAADAALNPVATGAGTNVKTCEFIARRLPLATTRPGARGFRIEDGRTGLLFDAEALGEVLSRMRRLFDEDPGRLRGIAEAAYAANASVIDMDACVGPLVEGLILGVRRLREAGGGGAPARGRTSA